MSKSIFTLILFTVSLNAFADIKVTNTDGWKLDHVKDDKLLQFVVPGAEYTLSKAGEDVNSGGDGTTITIRKIKKQHEEALGEKKSTWLRAIFSPEKLKKIQSSEEQQAILKVDGQLRYVAEIQFDSGTETPLSEAILALPVGKDLYLVMYENRGQTYRRHRKEALQLLKKIKIEVTAEEAPAKSE